MNHELVSTTKENMQTMKIPLKDITQLLCLHKWDLCINKLYVQKTIFPCLKSRVYFNAVCLQKKFPPLTDFVALILHRLFCFGGWMEWFVDYFVFLFYPLHFKIVSNLLLMLIFLLNISHQFLVQFESQFYPAK